MLLYRGLPERPANILCCFDNFVLCFDNFGLCFTNIDLCLKKYCVVFQEFFVVFADMGHRNFATSSDSKISGFTRPHVIGFVDDLFFFHSGERILKCPDLLSNSPDA